MSIGNLTKFLRSRVGIATILGFAGTMFLVGLLFGKAFSPNQASEKAGVAYLLSHFEYRLSGDDVVLVLPIDTKVYTYRLSTNTLSEDVRKLSELQSLRVENKWRAMAFDEALPLAGIALPGGLLGGSIVVRSAMSRASPAVRTAIMGTVTVFSAAGALIGFDAAYESDPDFDDPNFRAALSNPQYWRAAAEQVKTCSTPNNSSEECFAFMLDIIPRNLENPAPDGPPGVMTAEELDQFIRDPPNIIGTHSDKEEEATDMRGP